MDPLDVTFNSLLRLQAGVASVAQARRLGFRPAQIQHRRRTGRWISVLPGIVASPSVSLSWESRLVAAQLYLGGRVVPSHVTAGRLLGLDPFMRSPVLEFTALSGGHGFGAGLLVHRTARLDRIEITAIPREVPEAIGPDLERVGVVESLRCTTATRTLIDVAARCDPAHVASALDLAVRRGLTAPNVLARRLHVLGPQGRAGSRLLQELLLDSGGHSWLERRFLRLIREHGLPRPRPQAVFRAGGRTVARVDFLFEPTPVIVEVSGRLGHTSDVDRARDARRRNSLQRSGYLVLEFVTVDVIGDPAYVVGEVRAALNGQARTLRRM